MSSLAGKSMEVLILVEVDECSNLLRWKQTTMGRCLSDSCLVRSCGWVGILEANKSLRLRTFLQFH